jgi:uncharacterized protein
MGLANEAKREGFLMSGARRAFLTGEWRNLLMLNFAIDPEILKADVPRGLSLDFHGGETYVSVVGFQFLKARLMGFAVPFHQRFEEVNLRYYLRRETLDGVRHGVAFIKEIVPRLAVAAVARWVYNENFSVAPMDHDVPEDLTDGARVEYRWRIGAHWHRLGARVRGGLKELEEGSNAHFIAEHYWGYTKQPDGDATEYRVDHAPWRVWNVDSPELETDVAVVYSERFRETLARPPVSAFIAEGSPVKVYEGVRVPVPALSTGILAS